MRQNKHFVTIVCLILGAVLLCSAAVANIGNAGGYEAYKRGLIGLLNMDCYSGHGNVEMTLDGVSLFNINYTEKLDRSAKVGEAISYLCYDGTSELFDLSDGTEETWHVVNPKDHITNSPYTSYSYDSDVDSWFITTGYGIGGAFSDFNMDMNDEYNRKMLRIAELTVDMFVGDLKNNFVYVGSENGLKRYRVSLSGDQLPEIVQAVISLAFDSDSGSALWGYNNSYCVLDAVDLAAEDTYTNEYQTARRAAWNVIENEHDNTGTAVINKDLSIDWYPSTKDYFKTLKDINLETLLAKRDMDVLFMLLDGEPKITNATCDLAVDSQGRLMANTLSGSVEFKMIDGRWHEATLTIHGEFDSRDEVEISLPTVNPNAARIVDHSRSCKATDYEYTVTEYGRAITYHNTISAETSYESFYNRFDNTAYLHGFALIDEVFDDNLSNNVLSLYSAYDLDGSTEYYEVYPDVFAVASEFDAACAEWFADAAGTQTVMTAAEKYGIGPDTLMDALLEAYSDVTGKPFEGEHAVFDEVYTANVLNTYSFEYAPLDFISLFADELGVELKPVDLYDGEFDKDSINGDFVIADTKNSGAKFGIVAVSFDDLVNVNYATADYSVDFETAASEMGLTYEEVCDMFNAAFNCVLNRSAYFDAPEGSTLISDSDGIYCFD